MSVRSAISTGRDYRDHSSASSQRRLRQSLLRDKRVSLPARRRIPRRSLPMDLGLSGKRALVLSSSRGLGLGIAQALAAEGADVMLTARNAERLKAAAEAINALGKGRAHHHAGDLAGGVEAIHGAAMEALGGIDI